MHQAEDADRLIRIMELKVVRVTMAYLRECNIDIEEYEKQHNTVIGTGSIITGGTFTNSQVTSTTVNSGEGAGSQAYWVGRLAEELAKAHGRLDDPGLPLTPDLTDAVAAIEELQDRVVAFREELAAGPPPGPESQTMLRRRVKALLGVLLPVAEMIGGIAGFQDILHHLS